MRIVASELIPVYEGEGQKQLVNARELYEFLESRQEFANWIKHRLATYGFAEGIDFLTSLSKTPTGGRPRIEYWLTLDCAKEIAMVENNDRGQQIRRYLIAVEEHHRALMSGPYGPQKIIGQFAVPTTLPGALRLAADLQETVEAQGQVIKEMAPKAEFHDKVAASNDCQSIREVAKVLGTGQNRLFAWLRAQKILMADNQPYQEFIDRGYFRVLQQVWTDRQGGQHLSTKTIVTGKGLTWLQQRYHGGLRVIS